MRGKSVVARTFARCTSAILSSPSHWRELDACTGIVAHALFLGLATDLLVAVYGGIEQPHSITGGLRGHSESNLGTMRNFVRFEEGRHMWPAPTWCG